jgi:hypothetical protein
MTAKFKRVYKMPHILRNPISLFILFSAIVADVQATVENNWPEKLTLTLFIEEKNVNKGPLPVKVVLTNKTNQHLRFSIPIDDRQLVIYPLTPKGKQSLLSDLLRQVKGRRYANKEMEIEPHGQISFNRDFDLSPDKDHMKGKSFIELEAKFKLFRYNGNQKDLSTIGSNKAKYKIPKNVVH